MANGRAERGSERILVLNPGSTTTKLAVFEGEKCLFEDKISHSKEDLAQFAKMMDQLEYRKALIEKFLADRGIAVGSFSAVVGRGGLMRPIVSGTYRVNAAMLDDVRAGVQGEHDSNLGAVLAAGIATLHDAHCRAQGFDGLTEIRNGRPGEMRGTAQRLKGAPLRIDEEQAHSFRALTQDEGGSYGAQEDRFDKAGCAADKEVSNIG